MREYHLTPLQIDQLTPTEIQVMLDGANDDKPSPPPGQGSPMSQEQIAEYAKKWASMTPMERLYSLRK